jgi:regulatory protein
MTGKKQPAHEKALSLLAKRDLTEAQIRQSLGRAGYRDEDKDNAIDFLKEYGYVNDAAYAEKYLRELIRKGRGRRLVIGYMLRRGIAREIIDEAMGEGYTADVEYELALTLTEKVALSLPEDTPQRERARRVSQKLAAQGFGYDVISDIMDRYT